MRGKSNLKKLISKIMILAMVLISMSNAVPTQAHAAVSAKKLASTYLNATTKYLHLGNKKTGTFNFDIIETAKTKGATFSWYVKRDKGNPNTVSIDKNGVVIAKKAGTAYIGCKVTLSNGTVLRPEAKVVVRNNITKVDISNLPANGTILVGSKYDFNRTILNTEGGKGKATHGITRWEIAEDTADVEKITDKGIVSATKAGEFKLRAVSFQSKEKYNVWLKDKTSYAKYITAASKWYTISVIAGGTVTPTLTPTPTPTPTTSPGSYSGGPITPPTVSVSSVQVSGADGVNSVVRGETLQMIATVLPANASNKTVTWSVAPTEGSGAGTATINISTGLLTATGIGTVVVTATANNGVKGNVTVSVVVGKLPIITDVSISSNNLNNTKAMIGDIITLTFKSDEPVTKLSNFKINGSNPDTFTNVGNIYTATHFVDEGDLISGEPITFQINVMNAAGFYSLTIEATTDGSSVTIIDKMPRITDIKIISDSAKGPSIATIDDIITLTFKTDEPVTKLNNFKINGSNPDTFENEGNDYRATHKVDSGDVITGEPVTFQINVKNAAGIYSYTMEATTDGSSVTIVDKKPAITDINIASDNLNNTKAMIGDTITLTFKSDEPVTKLSNFKINGSNPDTFTNVEGNIYKVTHKVDSGDLITGEPATFQINVKNARGIYSLTVEATTDGSSVTIIEKMPRITDVNIRTNNVVTTKAKIGDTIILTFKTDETVTKLSNFKINGSNPDTFENEGNVYTATHLVDEGDPITGEPVTFQINVKNAAGIYSYTVEATTDGSSVTIIGSNDASLGGMVFASDSDRDPDNNLVLEGAKITLTKKDMTPRAIQETFAAFTNSEGKYELNNLEAGYYIIEVSLDGYVSYRNENYILEGSGIIKNFYLDSAEHRSVISGRLTIADEDIEAGNNEGLSGITLTLIKIGSDTTSPLTFLTDGTGRFTFEALAFGLYELVASMDGYLPITSEILINSTNYNLILEAIPDSNAGNGIATGTIISALTGSGAEAGLTLAVYNGYNTTNGTIVTTTFTGEGGGYSLDLPTGYYTILVTDDRLDPVTRYSSASFSVKILGNITIGNQNVVLTPILNIGEIRIVLTWGSIPSDLDSHLTGSMNDGGSFHIYYSAQTYYQNDTLMVNLDVDDTDSYGPETTTIYHQVNGVYKFYVHDYSNGSDSTSIELSQSGAIVNVYMEGSSRPIKTYYVPNNAPGTFWDVFAYDSTTGQFTDLNHVYAALSMRGSETELKDYEKAQ